MAVQVLVADDHPVARQGLRTFLSLDPDIEVIGEASDGAEAVDLSAQLHPDVALIDVMMPVMDGIAATRMIHERAPDVKVLTLTSSLDDAIAVRAVENGAAGCVQKDADAQQLRGAIKTVYSGQLYLPQKVTARLMAEIGKARQRRTLTEREAEVLELLAKGWPNKDIAAYLHISIPTVKTHVSVILSKLQVTSRTQAALLASTSVAAWTGGATTESFLVLPNEAKVD